MLLRLCRMGPGRPPQGTKPRGGQCRISLKSDVRATGPVTKALNADPFAVFVLPHKFEGSQSGERFLYPRDREPQCRSDLPLSARNMQKICVCRRWRVFCVFHFSLHPIAGFPISSAFRRIVGAARPHRLDCAMEAIHGRITRSSRHVWRMYAARRLGSVCSGRNGRDYSPSACANRL